MHSKFERSEGSLKLPFSPSAIVPVNNMISAACHAPNIQAGRQNINLFGDSQVCKLEKSWYIFEKNLQSSNDSGGTNLEGTINMKLQNFHWFKAGISVQKLFTLIHFRVYLRKTRTKTYSVIFPSPILLYFSFFCYNADHSSTHSVSVVIKN